MKTQEQLVEYYTKNLDKVKSSHNDNSEGSLEYIQYAQDMLDVVTEKGMDGLKEFWEAKTEEENLESEKINIQNDMVVIVRSIFSDLKQMFETMDKEEVEAFKKDNKTVIQTIIDIQGNNSEQIIEEYFHSHENEPKMISVRDIKINTFLNSVYILAIKSLNLVIKSNPTSLVKFRAPRDGYKSDTGLNIIDNVKKSNGESYINYFQGKSTIENFIKSIITNEGIELSPDAEEHMKIVGNLSIEEQDLIKELYNQVNKPIEKKKTTINTNTTPIKK